MTVTVDLWSRIATEYRSQGVQRALRGVGDTVT